MKKNFFYVLRMYIRKHLKNIAVHVMILLIFAAVFVLADIPAAAVGYAALLAAAASGLFVLHDFYKYYRRHCRLCESVHKVTVTLEELPAAADLIESDYQNLIHRLYTHAYAVSSSADTKYQEMIDYYTLWAHQIKTPISAMRVLLQSEETPMNARLSQELFKIERYVEMVLHYLRLESMSSDLVLEYYDLEQIVRQAAKKYATVFIYNKIKLDIKDIGCSVLTDQKWLGFVIEQLISNALKYTKTGTISIYMDSDAPLTLVIEDTGIGIQAEDLPRIFERGFTGYNGRMDKKSTGLGLYLCNRILRQLSHTISITSSLETGTKVLINLFRESV